VHAVAVVLLVAAAAVLVCAELRRGRADQARLGVRQQPRRVCLRQDLQRRITPGWQAQHVLGAARKLDRPGHPLPRPAPRVPAPRASLFVLAAVVVTCQQSAERKERQRLKSRACANGPRRRAAARTRVTWLSSSRGESSTLPEFVMWPPARAAPRAAGRPAASTRSSASRGLRTRTHAVSVAKPGVQPPAAPHVRGRSAAQSVRKTASCPMTASLRQLRARAALSHEQERPEEADEGLKQLKEGRCCAASLCARRQPLALARQNKRRVRQAQPALESACCAGQLHIRSAVPDASVRSLTTARHSDIRLHQRTWQP